MQCFFGRALMLSLKYLLLLLKVRVVNLISERWKPPPVVIVETVSSVSPYRYCWQCPLESLGVYRRSPEQPCCILKNFSSGFVLKP